MDFGKAEEKIAMGHIECIKSQGERGCSITVVLAALEKMMKNDPNVLGTLRAEYPIIETLARAMKEEIERMEEES